MSKGGFRAYVRVTRVDLAGGLDGKGRPYEGAEMELEGKLLEFKYKNLMKSPETDPLRKILKDGNCSVYIEFVEEQQLGSEFEEEGDQKHIGAIYLSGWGEGDIKAGPIDSDIRLQLPFSMFSNLLSMRSNSIFLETIHDLIAAPTDDQREVEMVALVRRVYFKPDLETLEPPSSTLEATRSASAFPFSRFWPGIFIVLMFILFWKSCK